MTPNDIPTVRACARPDCGADISHMRHGTLFCSRSCAAKARYRKQAGPKQPPKPASLRRQERRLEERRQAELTPEQRTQEDYERRRAAGRLTWEEMEAERQASEERAREEIEREKQAALEGRPDATARGRFMAGITTYEQYREESDRENEAHAERMRQLEIEVFGRPYTGTEEESLEEYFEHREAKREARAERERLARRGRWMP